VVGRVGGDEFVVLLNDLHAPSDSLAVAEKLRATLNEPLSLADRQLRVSISIGVAIFPHHGDESRQLTRAADYAMYHVKKNGGNHIRLANGPDEMAAEGGHAS
jgi:diguanylate cyclase (GGDEF)-like protein